MADCNSLRVRLSAAPRLLRVVSRLLPIPAVSLFILPTVMETKWPHGRRSHNDYRISGDVVGS